MKSVFSFLVLGLSLLLGGNAHAQPTAADRAAAEALFQQAQSLMEQGKAAEACPKYEIDHMIVRHNVPVGIDDETRA